MAKRGKAILLIGIFGLLGALAIWFVLSLSRQGAKAYRIIQIERVLSDHALAIKQVQGLAQELSAASGPLVKIVALAPAVKDINAIRAKTVKIGVGKASANVNVWQMICKISSNAAELDIALDGLTFVVDNSQELLNFCQQYDTNRLHFDQALASFQSDESSQNLARLSDAAAQFRDSVATIDSLLATLEDKLRSVHSVLVLSRDLLAKIDYGPVRESTQSLANGLNRPIDVTNEASGQVGNRRAGLEEAMKALSDIAHTASRE